MAWDLSKVRVLVSYTVVIMTLSGQWTVSRVKGTDVAVTCAFLKTCILPCTFPPAPDELIHWLINDDVAVHSFYNGGDQFDQQDQRFKSRTALFPDQISRGNASLQLTRVSLKDQGRYKCYTSTIKGNKESFIRVSVEAQVQSVDIQLSGDNLVCSSRGIYPQPELAWSTNPPSVTKPHLNPPSTQTDPQGLYNITSTWRIMENNTGVDHICSVSTNTLKRTATLRRQAPVQSSLSKDASISCKSDSTLPTFDLLSWKFNQSELILSLSSPTAKPQLQERWKGQAAYESGSLRLRKLTPSLQGTYTCECRSAGDTYMSVTDLLILEDHTASSANVGLVIGVIIGGILVLVLVSVLALLGWRVFQGKQVSSSCSRGEPETTSLPMTNGGGTSPQSPGNDESAKLKSDTETDPTTDS